MTEPKPVSSMMSQAEVDKAKYLYALICPLQKGDLVRPLEFAERTEKNWVVLATPKDGDLVCLGAVDNATIDIKVKRAARTDLVAIDKQTGKPKRDPIAKWVHDWALASAYNKAFYSQFGIPASLLYPVDLKEAPAAPAEKCGRLYDIHQTVYHNGDGQPLWIIEWRCDHELLSNKWTTIYTCVPVDAKSTVNKVTYRQDELTDVVPEPVAPAKPPFKVGDRVEYHGISPEYHGVKGTVVEPGCLTAYDKPCVAVQWESKKFADGACVLECVRLAPALETYVESAAPAGPRFKVGDRVKYIGHLLKTRVNTEGTVTRWDDEKNVMVAFGETDVQGCYASSLELLPEREPRFKEGQIVYYTATDGEVLKRFVRGVIPPATKGAPAVYRCTINSSTEHPAYLYLETELTDVEPVVEPIPVSIHPGDVVMLKSGGPLMTADLIRRDGCNPEKSYAVCCYFPAEGSLQVRADFLLTSLNKK